MMESANINVTIRMNKDVKTQMDELCAKLGMNFSTAFNIFAAAMLRKQGIPFDVSLDAHKGADPFYSEENMAHLRASIAELEVGKFAVHDLTPFEKEAGR